MSDKSADEERISSGPLEPWELRELRKLLRNEERVRWLWSSVRLWGYYVAAFVAGIYATQDYLIKLFKKVFP